MENFCFEVPVNRTGIGNMKGAMAAGLPDEENMIVLSGAEMDFATAPVICQAISDFAKKGIYGFTLPDLKYRNTIVNWMEKVRELHIEADEIVPTLGTIMALNTAVRAFTEPGDGVIIQHPSYYRHDVAIKNNGRKVVINLLKENDGRYQVNFEDLEKQMRQENNKMMVLCNPQNPTGKVFSKEDLKKIADLADKYNVIVFADEIFAEITFDNHVTIPYASVDSKHSVMCTSLGKVYNFTGVNHANLIIKNTNLREAYLKQRKIDHFGSIDPFFYTALIAGYSQQGYGWIQQMKAHVWKNYQKVKRYLKKYLPDISVSPLEGGFMIWIDFRRLGVSDSFLEEFLEKKVKVLGDPGYEYGAAGSGFFRFNIATTTSRIELFLERLQVAYEETFGNRQ